jgi:hypothetical protein
MADQHKSQVQEPIVDDVDADEEIRRRAYEISQSGDSGTPEENWHRAEREVGRPDPTAASQAEEPWARWRPPRPADWSVPAGDRLVVREAGLRTL